MASSKIFLIFLLAALIATPVAVAQLGGLSGLLGLIHIDGVLFCTLNGKTNGTTTPIFPNASVQLQCGAGNVVSSTTTNGSGAFSLALDPLQNTLLSLLSNCSVVVTTPLSTCNASLPSVGFLQSALQLVGKTSVGLIRIVNLGANAFQLISNIN